MKLFLFGYGKLGQAIAQSAEKQGHKITGYTTSSELSEEMSSALSQADVAVEVSTPATAVQNIRQCLDAKIPVIVGTTGWYDQYEACVAYCKEKNGAMLCATNFSIGVNLFFELNKNLAAIMNGHAYKVAMSETHHIHKVDSPSGTAISLADQILEQNESLNTWIEGESTKEDELPIAAIRSGEVPGTHEIRYISSIDTISIKHEAHNREGFANGAVIAAQWIVGKKGVFSMNDVISVKKS